MMEEFFGRYRELLDFIIQGFLVVIPLILTWFVRTYVRGTALERKLGAIVRLSNTAIDYAENLDKRGQINPTERLSKGGQKLQLAGQWMESELKRMGISMSDEEARQWISAEFQKRMGEVHMVDTLADLARRGASLIQKLDENGLIEGGPSEERLAYMAGLAADWVVAQYAREGAVISREEAITWVRAELLQMLQLGGAALAGGGQLPELATRAVAFLEEIRGSTALADHSEAMGFPAEIDIATAWLLTEAAKQGHLFTAEEISAEIGKAMGDQGN
ncbi:MAG: phage holin, LLH family [Ardenticatenaceae bacterium]|nr:phage holin, LLH family [Ardenticatenaceae bacterium]